jgi:hypothetical protein
MNTDPQGHWDYQVKVERLTLDSLNKKVQELEARVAVLENPPEPEQLEIEW